MKHYFVSYTFSKKGDGVFDTMGFGSMKVSMPQKIKTYDDILLITSFIKEQNGFKEVAILNWKKIKEINYAKTNSKFQSIVDA